MDFCKFKDLKVKQAVFYPKLPLSLEYNFAGLQAAQSSWQRFLGEGGPLGPLLFLAGNRMHLLRAPAARMHSTAVFS